MKSPDEITFKRLKPDRLLSPFLRGVLLIGTTFQPGWTMGKTCWLTDNISFHLNFI